MVMADVESNVIVLNLASRTHGIYCHIFLVKDINCSIYMNKRYDNS